MAQITPNDPAGLVCCPGGPRASSACGPIPTARTANHRVEVTRALERPEAASDHFSMRFRRRRLWRLGGRAPSTPWGPAGWSSWIAPEARGGPQQSRSSVGIRCPGRNRRFPSSPNFQSRQNYTLSFKETTGEPRPQDTLPSRHTKPPRIPKRTSHACPCTQACPGAVPCVPRCVRPRAARARLAARFALPPPRLQGACLPNWNECMHAARGPSTRAKGKGQGHGQGKGVWTHAGSSASGPLSLPTSIARARRQPTRPMPLPRGRAFEENACEPADGPTDGSS